MKRSLSIIALFIFLLVACSTPDRTTAIPTAGKANPVTPTISARAPVFINHKQPDIQLDVTVFDKAGCSPDQLGFRYCPQDSPLYALGCDEIEEPSTLLGALKPAYPIMLCETDYHQSLLDEWKDIDKRLWDKCDVAPQKVCTSIEEIAGQQCGRTLSGICEKYQQALINKCKDHSVDVCDPLDGILAVNSEVREKFEDEFEHLSGGYTYHSDGAYFFSRGGLITTFYRYVIFQDNQFVLIKTEDEFRQIFASLEGPEEALAYVKAATGLIELYGLNYDPDHFEYFVNVAEVIEDTHAEEVADGYVVNLFKQNLECSIATTSIRFHVTRNGHITQLPELPRIFKERSRNGECRIE